MSRTKNDQMLSKAASAEIPMLQVVSSLVALVVFPGRRKNSKIMQRKTLAQADGVSTTRLVEGQWWKNTLKNDDGQQEWRTNVQWHQKTRLRKKGQERRTHVGEPTKCLSKLLLLWLQFFKPCPHLWYWKLFSKCLVLASGRGKNKKYSKTKNHWPDLMVSSLHDYWKVLWSYSDCVKTGRAQFHWTLNWKTWNERLEFPQLAMRWP